MAFSHIGLHLCERGRGEALRARVRFALCANLFTFGFRFGFGFGFGFRPQLAATRRNSRQLAATCRELVRAGRRGIFCTTVADTLMLCPAWEPKVGFPAYRIEGNAAFGRQRVERGIYVLCRNSFPQRENPSLDDRGARVAASHIVYLRDQTDPKPKFKIRKACDFFVVAYALFYDPIRHFDSPFQNGSSSSGSSFSNDPPLSGAPYAGIPPVCADSDFRSTNAASSATTSEACLLMPSLSVYVRVCRLPHTRIALPLPKYRQTNSAVFRQHTMLMKSVSCLPSAEYLRFTPMVNEATLIPVCVCFNSGVSVRYPIRITLLNAAICYSSVLCSDNIFDISSGVAVSMPRLFASSTVPRMRRDISAVSSICVRLYRM
nr:MAG TPA: hypothetical protein [Caudoviricetes sp.]